jgi:hypothetical protein
MTGSRALTLSLIIVTGCLGCKNEEGIPKVTSPSYDAPHQKDLPIEAKRTRSVMEASAAKVLIKKGLELADNPGAVATFGWGAAAAGLRLLSADASEETISLRDLVETRGLRQRSVPAFRSVMSVYQTDSARRASRLSTPAAGDDAFLLAAIAELLFGKDRKAPPAGSPPESQFRRDTHDVLRMRSGGAPEPGLLDRIERRLAQPELENIVPLALAADCEQIHGPRWGASDGRVRVLERLMAFAGAVPKTAKESVLVATARATGARLQTSLDQELTMRSLLLGYDVNGIRDEKFVGDRTVTVTPDPFTLEADYHPTIFAVGLKWGQTTWHSQVSSSSTAPITKIDKHLLVDPHYLPTFPVTIADASWLCALNAATGNPDSFVGCTYGPLQRAGIRDVGTDGVSAYGFGMSHRIWMPVLDPNNGAVKWGAGRPTFKLKCGFRPAPECLFVALRWKGSGNPSMNYLSGTLRIVGTPASSIPTEMGTNWTLICIEPGVQLEIETKFEAKIQQQSTRTIVNHGYNVAQTIEDYLELLPIDETNFDAFSYVALGISSDPITLNAPSRSSNGLLTYAATLTKAATNPDWPVPRGADAGLSGAQALVRLGILRSLSRADLQHVPGFGPDTAQNPWRARQALLQNAMPLLCERVWRKVERPLTLQIALQGKPLERAGRARARVTQALEAVAQLTVDLGNELLRVSAAELKQGDPAIIKDLELLRAALVGADEELAVLERELASGRALCCHVLQALQHPGFPLDNPKHLPMKSDDAVLGLCTEE